ncbi:type I phosphodiesterase/nucleotide pyrophosphatase [Ornithinimicrobium humiphilum]|uniref:Type I phosphodiesterase/nucleotide pyrophosphatase n=1 Tax=Ornithinimicrobium humiphilum TaxID=125288 RepID=A0A543KNB7_9MICO|nr:alkaline phosphatase family protein [Ornithinimicrobium humiphilum]TQM96567.1 type I phosphodiesterase/nucleotide pyrophosphatase [Ornithinimicrobium humiphilum]
MAAGPTAEDAGAPAGDVVARAAETYKPPGPGEGLPSVLPAALVALGADLPHDIPAPTWALPETRRVVVVLVDGLGARQLERRTGHAPFLRTLASPVADAHCGFPSTTSTSLTSLGTGRRAGDHGIIGWQTALRGDRLFNHLGWREGPDPHSYQPLRTLLQEAGRANVTATTVSRTAFETSGFTRAALRGGGYLPADTAEERTAGVLRALAEAGRRGRALVYAYWDEVDKAGHVHGPDTLEWGEAVEAVDAFVAGLAEQAPEGTVIVVTSDHGMVEAPVAERRDLAIDPVLDEGVRLLAGEPRAPQAWCRRGAVDDVVATWRDELGDDALVLRREEAIEAGWFGPVREGYAERIGEVVAAMLGRATVLDSRLLRPEVLRLRGHHGSITEAETAVPLLVHQV